MSFADKLRLLRNNELARKVEKERSERLAEKKARREYYDGLIKDILEYELGSMHARLFPSPLLERIEKAAAGGSSCSELRNSPFA